MLDKQTQEQVEKYAGQYIGSSFYDVALEAWTDCAQWMQEREKSEARQAIIDAKVFRICSSCNTEFEMEFGVSISEKVSAFQKCTHCGVRNDTWISIRLNGQKY